MLVLAGSRRPRHRRRRTPCARARAGRSRRSRRTAAASPGSVGQQGLQRDPRARRPASRTAASPSRSPGSMTCNWDSRRRAVAARLRGRRIRPRSGRCTRAALRRSTTSWPPRSAGPSSSSSGSPTRATARASGSAAWRARARRSPTRGTTSSTSTSSPASRAARASRKIADGGIASSTRTGDTPLPNAEPALQLAASPDASPTSRRRGRQGAGPARADDSLRSGRSSGDRGRPAGGVPLAVRPSRCTRNPEPRTRDSRSPATGRSSAASVSATRAALAVSDRLVVCRSADDLRDDARARVASPARQTAPTRRPLTRKRPARLGREPASVARPRTARCSIHSTSIAGRAAPPACSSKTGAEEPVSSRRLLLDATSRLVWARRTRESVHGSTQLRALSLRPTSP